MPGNFPKSPIKNKAKTSAFLLRGSTRKHVAVIHIGQEPRLIAGFHIPDLVQKDHPVFTCDEDPRTVLVASRKGALFGSEELDVDEIVCVDRDVQTLEQVKHGLLTPDIGNTYSGAVPLGLSNILDVAEPGDKIFVVSYGSGAGSDAFTLTVNEELKERRDLAPKTQNIINDKQYVDYAVYAKFKGKIKM